jgi:hypothetical protein
VDKESKRLVPEREEVENGLIIFAGGSDMNTLVSNWLQ